jgi:hypothetical protein
MILFSLGGLAINHQSLSLELAEISERHGDIPRGHIGQRFNLSASKLIDRRARSPWLRDGGGMDMYQRAKASLKELMSRGQGEPLAGEAKDAVREAREEKAG